MPTLGSARGERPGQGRDEHEADCEKASLVSTAPTGPSRHGFAVAFDRQSLAPPG